MSTDNCVYRQLISMNQLLLTESSPHFQISFATHLTAATRRISCRQSCIKLGLAVHSFSFRKGTVPGDRRPLFATYKQLPSNYRKLRSFTQVRQRVTTERTLMVEKLLRDLQRYLQTVLSSDETCDIRPLIWAKESVLNL
jgi:hypothetical protein